MHVQITRDDLNRAVALGTVSEEQAAVLWKVFTESTSLQSSIGPENCKEIRAKFDFVHLAYYAGIALVIFALAWVLGI